MRFLLNIEKRINFDRVIKMKKISIIAAMIFSAGCSMSYQEAESETLECSMADHAAQYTVYYEYVSGSCPENLEPAGAYEPLLNVADCKIVADGNSPDMCTWSFVLECTDELGNEHMSFFSSTKQADGTMKGTASFSGWPCEGEYNTVLVPVE